MTYKITGIHWDCLPSAIKLHSSCNRIFFFKWKPLEKILLLHEGKLRVVHRKVKRFKILTDALEKANAVILALSTFWCAVLKYAIQCRWKAQNFFLILKSLSKFSRPCDQNPHNYVKIQKNTPAQHQSWAAQ